MCPINDLTMIKRITKITIIINIDENLKDIYLVSNVCFYSTLETSKKEDSTSNALVVIENKSNALMVIKESLNLEVSKTNDSNSETNEEEEWTNEEYQRHAKFALEQAFINAQKPKRPETFEDYMWVLAEFICMKILKPVWLPFYLVLELIFWFNDFQKKNPKTGVFLFLTGGIVIVILIIAMICLWPDEISSNVIINENFKVWVDDTIEEMEYYFEEKFVEEEPKPPQKPDVRPLYEAYKKYLEYRDYTPYKREEMGIFEGLFEQIGLKEPIPTIKPKKVSWLEWINWHMKTWSQKEFEEFEEKRMKESEGFIRQQSFEKLYKEYLQNVEKYQNEYKKYAKMYKRYERYQNRKKY